MSEMNYKCPKFMSENRYFKVEYDEEWYLFDSATISEQLVKEQAEYGYGVFANSLSPSEIVGLLNELSEENEKLRKDLYIVQTDCKNAKESKEHWRNKAKELEEKNKQIGFLKRDLYTIIRDTKETPFGNSLTMTEIRERWE